MASRNIFVFKFSNVIFYNKLVLFTIFSSCSFLICLSTLWKYPTLTKNKDTTEILEHLTVTDMKTQSRTLGNESNGHTQFIRASCLDDDKANDTYKELSVSDDMPWSYTVTNTRLDTCSVKLPNTLKNYRNPCWFESFHMNTTTFDYRKTFYYQYDCQKREHVQNVFRNLSSHYRLHYENHENKRLRCYPYFYVIGAPKCGTTDFHVSLTSYHPHIVSGTRKESRYWVRRRHGITSSHACPTNTGQVAMFADYLDLFDNFVFTTSDRQDLEMHFNPQVTGDFTPDDFYYLHKWEDIPGNEGEHEPRVTLAHILYSIRPQTRIIFIAREPVERLYSHFLFTTPPGKYTLSNEMLHKNVVQQLNQTRVCRLTSSIKNCAYSQPFHLTQGLYDVFIRDWLEVFPRNQIMIIRFEDYKRSRKSVLDDVVIFLGLNGNITTEGHVEKKQIALKGRRHLPLKKKTQKLLREFYKPHVKAFEELIGQPMDWNY